MVISEIGKRYIDLISISNTQSFIKTCIQHLMVVSLMKSQLYGVSI